VFLFLIPFLYASQQSWCPVCRTRILPDEDEDEATADEDEDDAAAHTLAMMSKVNSSENTMDVKANLGALFTEAADDR
jgi:hypothetical protein